MHMQCTITLYSQEYLDSVKLATKIHGNYLLILFVLKKWTNKKNSSEHCIADILVIIHSSTIQFDCLNIYMELPLQNIKKLFNKNFI